ncbi:hypothetical protein [Paenibacillus turpanensis]|nr:hypothetical protein [Paenibacillus turpanensis]
MDIFVNHFLGSALPTAAATHAKKTGSFDLAARLLYAVLTLA